MERYIFLSLYYIYICLFIYIIIIYTHLIIYRRVTEGKRENGGTGRAVANTEEGNRRRETKTIRDTTHA